MKDCTIAVKWWDIFTYQPIMTKVTESCTDQLIASNHFLLKKSFNQGKIASSGSKQEFRKHLLETLSQLPNDEQEDEPAHLVLPGYSQGPYDDIEL